MFSSLDTHAALLVRVDAVIGALCGCLLSLAFLDNGVQCLFRTS